MSQSTPTATAPAGAPALVVPCSGVDLAQVSETHAVLVVQNPLVRAEVPLTADAARTVGQALLNLADDLAPEGPRLVTPPSGLVVPGRG